MNPIASYIVARLKEPSSHAGLAALMQGLKMIFPAYGVAFDIASMVMGAAAATTAG
jgi:hypothetical protein